METKNINVSYYTKVIRRYLSKHNGEDLQDYCHKRRISYSKFMTVLEQDEILHQRYLQSHKPMERELPLCRLVVDDAPAVQEALEDVSLRLGDVVVRIGSCKPALLSSLLNGLEGHHA